MRCPECGFISFDYLDRCLKCRTSLIEERSRLHLLPIQPKPIPILQMAEKARLGMKKEPVVQVVQKENISGNSRPSVKQEPPELDLTYELPPEDTTSLEIELGPLDFNKK